MGLVNALVEELGTFRIPHLDATRLREPSERISSGILAPDASNLATILADTPPREPRARPVGKPKKPSDSAFVASLREVDMLLHAADAEAAE
ncbi:hypothetical protein [Polyangium jinanense]|uniref:hypothetical protein n=1 Tax=Polyangium jinanense TaxID=2829994 RepID=UPI002340A442|nr:hypothetical protein [Polyangium jinanense]